eukprot:SAG11_NODE_498_length_8940_cov_11.447121_12_plen_50_part_00
MPKDVTKFPSASYRPVAILNLTVLFTVGICKGPILDLLSYFSISPVGLY